ncbi:hypothetical protein B0H14DRAFT_1351612, partial [Mycena olivaceomarginata]
MQPSVVFIVTALLVAPLRRCRPQSPASSGRTALALPSSAAERRLENVLLSEAARSSQSVILMSPVKSSSLFLAVATILALMARAWCLVAALDVEPRLPELIGRVLGSFESLVVIATKTALG